MQVSPETLRLLLDHDPATGAMTWRERPVEMFKTPRSAAAWSARFAGERAFATTIGGGYLAGRVFDRAYYAHRVIWALHYGCWPEAEIDHINGAPNDNRITNLREATSAQNKHNANGHRNRRHKLPKGVYLRPVRRSPYCAVICAGRKATCVGYFATAKEASEAYTRAAGEMRGDFALHNSRGR